MENNNEKPFAKIKKTRNRTDLNENSVFEVLEECFGNVTMAAGKLKVSPSRLKAFIDKKPKLKSKMEGLRSMLVDLAEVVIIQKLGKEMDLKAAMYVLNSLGGHRGWGNKIEEIEDDDNIEGVTIIEVDVATIDNRPMIL